MLRKAESDLKAARVLINEGDDEAFVDVAAYLCQQAAEKAVKAVYLANKIKVDRTHRISLLIASLSRQGCDTTVIDPLGALEPDLSDWEEHSRYTLNYVMSRRSVLDAMAVIERVISGLRSSDVGYDQVEEGMQAYLRSRDGP
jgi:HEPN domain-containing protein